MKKAILTITIILISMTFCFAQKIEVKKVFGGYKYFQNGQKLTMNTLSETMKENTSAFELIKKAKSNNTISFILGGVGGALIGYQLGQEISEKDANWAVAGVGAGLIVIAIPISSKVNKQTNRAVEMYNSSLNSTTYNSFNPEFNIISNENGIGLALNF